MSVAAPRREPPSPPANQGLSSKEAQERLQTFGPNELAEPQRETIVKRFGKQLVEPMSILLITAAVVAWAGLGERLDGSAILAIVFANILIALLQEGKTANALSALRRMETPTARTFRDGRVGVVAARDLVPGDLVTLAAGDRVPADLSLLATSGFEVDESMLTGESLPVRKLVGVAPASPDEERSKAFAGTYVFRGSATGEVVDTGPRTRLGAIATHLESKQPPTPLQKELRGVSSRLGVIAVCIAVGVFGVMLLRFGVNKAGLETAFLTSAALAVAAVPEGLPTVVTVGLALGVRRMAARGSIVRRLPAVETLGSTDVILTDKTGTLTENKMRLDAICLPDGSVASLEDIPPVVANAMLEVMVLCNDATLDPPVGDPLEIAMLEAVGEVRTFELRRAHPRREARPFDPESRSMATLNASETGDLVLVKGAPEAVVGSCASFVAGKTTTPMRDDDRERLLALADELAGSGARLLGLARKEVGARDRRLSEEEKELTFLGFVAMRDPVRAEARSAVADASGAGIRIVMVTGDHPGTASTVAAEVGLSGEGARVVTGADLKREGFPPDPLSAPVYARVDPEQKLALTMELQARGHVVAVTGDGVNDAPALRRADIGVAMGRSGSDVAREAAAMVVTDDDLATIVHAVREGRGIYDNIRKVVEYLVAGNLSEILVVIGGLIFFPHMGVPLLPLQLLWLNLLTDGFPALAFAVDPLAPDLMRRLPRSRSDHLLALSRLKQLFGRATLISSSALGSLAFAHFVLHQPWPHARSSMFSVLMTAHLLYAFAVRRSEGRPDRANPWLFAAVGGGLALQTLIVSLPLMQRLFSTVALSPSEWLLVAIGGIWPVVTISVVSARSHRAQKV